MKKQEKQFTHLGKGETEILDIFPTRITIHPVDVDQIKIVTGELKETFESGIKTSTASSNLFTLDTIKYLNNEIKHCLNQILAVYQIQNYTFSVTDIWLNAYEKNDYQGAHVHPSDFSFIIYYDVDHSHTVFNSPSKLFIEATDNRNFGKHFEPNCKKGDMLIFPSYLEHWVRPNSNQKTIAGNIKIIKLNA